MRKIVQVSAVSLNEYGGMAMIAVCDDGTTWCHDAKGWTRNPDIPQDDSPAERPQKSTA